MSGNWVGILSPPLNFVTIGDGVNPLRLPSELVIKGGFSVLLRASPPSELPTVVVTLMIKTTAPWDIGCKQLPHLMIEHTWLLAVGDAININELYFTFTTFSLGFHGDGVCEWSAWAIGGCLFSRQNGKLHSQKPRQEKQIASKVLMNTSRPWNTRPVSSHISL